MDCGCVGIRGIEIIGDFIKNDGISPVVDCRDASSMRALRFWWRKLLACFRFVVLLRRLRLRSALFPFPKSTGPFYAFGKGKSTDRRRTFSGFLRFLHFLRTSRFLYVFFQSFGVSLRRSSCSQLISTRFPWCRESRYRCRWLRSGATFLSCCLQS
jgi:hypothetical protein